MKKKYYLFTSLMAASLLGLTSCIDNDYDLTDIDTTSKFEVKNLTLPLNIEQIVLDQVLDIEEGDEIVKETVNGKVQYAIKKSGTFNSDPINVSDFSTSEPNIAPRSTTLELTDLRTATEFLGDVKAYYDITTFEHSTFEANADNFDESIKKIEKLGVKARFTNKLAVSGLPANIVSKMSLVNLKIQYPKGLIATTNMGTYDPVTGIYDLSSEKIIPNANGEVEITIDVTALDIPNSNIKIDYDKRSLKFADEIYVIQGRVNIEVDNDDDIPNQATFSINPSLSRIEVKTFTGEIEYKMDQFSIDPINLSNIPEFLSQSGTSIILDNPQIYMSFNNPLTEYGTYIETGLKLINGDNKKEYTLDNKVFQTTSAPENQFVLSPKAPESLLADYSKAKHVSFTSLKEILKDGIPSKIEVDVIAPTVPQQKITDFRLGENLSPVNGKYEFYTPLKLGNNSMIVYTDTLHGWNDEDVDKIEVSKAVASLDVSTDIPMSVELWVSPVGIDNKVIGNIKSNTVIIDANAKNKHIELVIEGDIKHINGMIFKAKAQSIENGEILSPEMKIDVDNFKLTLTGSIETEL